VLGEDAFRDFSSSYDNITVTGQSHPIVIEAVHGIVSDGDELVAYANNLPIGSSQVNLDGPTLIVAWKSLYEYGVDTPGYHDGDTIELRLYSQDLGRELLVQSNLNSNVYGETPITSGDATVLDKNAVPEYFSLSKNYPNPFNPVTNIDFSIPSDSHILISVYDMQGREIETLVNDFYQTGYYTINWDAKDNASGIYILNMTTNKFSTNQKLMLIK